MGENFQVSRSLCPLIAVAAALVFYWTPWFVIKATAFIPLSVEMSIADIVSESLPTSLWFWATVIGFVLVIIGGLPDWNAMQSMTKVGGILIVSFPVRSIWQVMNTDVDGASMSPGWGLIVVLVAGGAIILLSSKIGENPGLTY